MARLVLILVLSGYMVSCEKMKEDAPPVTGESPVPSRNHPFSAVRDTFRGVPLVVIGSRDLNFFASFINDKDLLFSLPDKPLPVVLQDQEGNEWDVFGKAVSGPRKGERLTPAESYTGYWFAISTFYPVTTIYGQNLPMMGFDSLAASEDWLVNIGYVRDGGPGKDGIPALEDPEIKLYLEKDYIENGFYLEDQDLVVGLQVDSIAIAYPHPILNWHEIVNDNVNDTWFAVSYCPLTGTAASWNRKLQKGITTFGVSGLLYNNNLLPYDRATESVWSQIRNECIHGELIGSRADLIPIVETTWETWKQMYPRTWVLTENTGYSRGYTYYPYGDYRTLHDWIFFPNSNKDDRIPAKERVYGIIVDGEAKVYRFDSF